MAIYRKIHLSYWTDPKVDDDFTPEDKYFYLYLLTNPHTNICGCYELGEKQCSRETGYNQETVSRLLKRFEEVHDVIRYNTTTKEVLLLNWYKYNWTASKDLLKNVNDVAQTIKCDEFREYILALANDDSETVPTPSPHPVGTSVTVTDYSTDNSTDTDSVKQVNDVEDMFGYNEYLLEAVRDWFEYKKQRKEKYQPVGKKSLLTTIQNNVSKYGEDAVVEVIRESMGSGYKGILWNNLKQIKTNKQTSRYSAFDILRREENNDKNRNS